MIVILETNYNYSNFNQWKRENVTLRGIKEMGVPNNVSGQFGRGLYTVPLSNKSLAKQYGDVHFVVNGKPKSPKIFQDTNQAEIFIQGLIDKFCKEHNEDYDLRFFEKHTSIEEQALELGIDGIEIKGREMVNYNPKNVKYFSNIEQLKSYYQSLVRYAETGK